MNNLLIAHAGGAFQEMKYTNSKQAIIYASKRVNLIELDVVSAYDGLVIAHDGLERKYGLDHDFSGITVANFIKQKYMGKLESIDFKELCKISKKLNVKFILDLKATDADYEESINYIAKLCMEYDVFSNFIIQVYERSDMHSVNKYPFHGVMIALWKNYGNIFSENAMKFVSTAINTSLHFDFVALSIRYKRPKPQTINIDNNRFTYYQNFNIPIYLHGQSDSDEEMILSRGFGLFTHNIDSDILTKG